MKHTHTHACHQVTGYILTIYTSEVLRNSGLLTPNLAVCAHVS